MRVFKNLWHGNLHLFHPAENVPLELHSSCYYTVPFSLPSPFITAISKSVRSQRHIPSVRITKKWTWLHSWTYILHLLHPFIFTSPVSLLLPHKTWQWYHYCSYSTNAVDVDSTKNNEENRFQHSKIKWKCFQVCWAACKLSPVTDQFQSWLQTLEGHPPYPWVFQFVLGNWTVFSAVWSNKKFRFEVSLQFLEKFRCSIHRRFFSETVQMS